MKCLLHHGLAGITINRVIFSMTLPLGVSLVQLLGRQLYGLPLRCISIAAGCVVALGSDLLNRLRGQGHAIYEIDDEEIRFA